MFKINARRLKWASLVAAATLCVTPATFAADAAATSGSWLYFGGSTPNNTRSASGETIISPTTAPNLKLKWEYTTAGDVSATPTIEGNDLYLTDWGGYLHKINRTDGSLVWKHKISEYTGSDKSISRASPAIADSVVVLGDRGIGTGLLMAVDKVTGKLAWKTRLDDNDSTVITQSPMVYNGVVYVGVSSVEEGKFAGRLKHRGSLVALDVNTGAILWKTYTTPEGYSGVSVWGSTPVVDPQRGSIYFSTGNNHSVPDDVAKCIDSTTDASAKLACMSPDNYFDSIVAVDMKTGAVKWASKLNNTDVWFGACTVRLPNCQVDAADAPDLDFASGPNLINTTLNGKAVQYVGAGQKSGVYWALNPDDGKVVWSNKTGPASFLGGIEWGSATDGKRIYIANGNMSHTPFTINGTNQTWRAGAWTAIDAATGAFIWQVPANGMGPRQGSDKLHSSLSPPVTVANGVVFFGSADGLMSALDASTGKTLWTFQSGGTTNSGPAVVDGVVYWGSGYAQWGGKGNNKLYAFSPN